MSDLVQERFSEIYEAFQNAKIKKARKLLNDLAKRGPFNNSQKVLISSFFSRLGNPKRAINILDAEMTDNQIKNASIDELKIQFQLASVLNTFGATYKSERLISRVIFQIERKGFNPELAIENYLSKMTYIHITNRNYSKAKLFALQILEKISPESPQWLHAHIQLATVHALDGNRKEAMSVLNVISQVKTLNPYFKILLHLKYAHVEYLYKNYKRALKHCTDSKPYIKTIKSDHWLKAKYINTKGQILFAKGEVKKSRKCFKEHFEFLKNIPHFPNAKVENGYFLEMTNSKGITIEQKIANRCSLNNHLYPYLLGKSYPEDSITKLPRIYRERYQKTKDNIWLVKGNKITSLEYENSPKMKFPSKSRLDLKAGFYNFKNMSPRVLSEIQHKALYTLICSGSIGVSLWGLIDFVYRHDFISPDVGESRIKLLLKQLTSMGFKFKRKNNVYFIDFSKLDEIIIPMSFEDSGLHHYLIHKFGRISPADIVETFGVHQATAYRWIQNWEENDILPGRFYEAS